MALYFIALLPPESIRKKIHRIKLEITEKYEAKRALKLPAHITMQIPFRMESEQEENLFRLLEDFSGSQQEFPVKLKDFGRFGQKVIFINIENHAPLIQLHSSLQEKLVNFINFKSGENFPKIHPHITLATRDLHYKQFSPAWAEFKERSFSDEFMANKLSLLRHNGKTWDILHEFKFK